MVNLLQGKGNSMRGVRRDRYLQATALGLLLALGAASAQAQDAEKKKEGEEGTTVLETITVLSAEDQLKQMPGVSTITASDLQKTPVTNDISEIIRKMPGVNLTGTTASGQRGNQRQIDLRGMGPENTLILIDGKPVLSRNAVRMGRAGERDTRGDTNWVPAEAIERIEVIRGPAAARYGSGAAGGVVNIITKRPDKLTTTVSTHLSVPQHSAEGHTVRGNIVTGGPINDYMTFRLTGNYNKTFADDADINADASISPTDVAAGREGVENRDLRALFSIAPTDDHVFDIEGAWSRQANIFAGDRQLSATNPVLNSLIGENTNEMERGTLSLTHKGEYDFGDSNSYIQWENTRNWRYFEGLAGSPEGSINSTDSGTSVLNNLTAKSEWNLPLDLGFEQKLTLGTEFRGEWMKDATSLRQATTVNGVPVVIPGVATNGADRDPNINAWMLGLYLEDNIYVTDRFTLTPGLRFDHHDYFGANWSPSLNASYEFTDEITLKAGVARAFKAPNLFQLNPNYVYYTMGNGCPEGYTNTITGASGCFVIGNPDLDAETSWNKEIGINYNNADGWNAGVTYFHNDYKNKIQSGMIPEGTASGSTAYGMLFRWENVPEAVVSGIEANLSVPLHENLTWSTNGTYMIQSENKSNGQPLSLVPEYTVNTALDWAAREDLTLTVSATHYGKIESPTVTATTGSAVANQKARDPYTLVNIGALYDINETYRLSAGVTNVFDKRIFREGSGNSAGANTYNEPGRTFYVSLTATF